MAFPGHPLGNGLTATAAKASTKQPLTSSVYIFIQLQFFFKILRNWVCWLEHLSGHHSLMLMQVVLGSWKVNQIQTP